MRLNSLAFRLTASAAAVSLVLLIVAGLLLANIFSNAVERNFDARLQAVLDGLLASVDLENGELKMKGAIADTRFSLPLSGWYWQITPADDLQGKGLFSPSLLGEALKFSKDKLKNRDAADIARFFTTDSNQTRIRAIEQQFTLFEGNRQYSFIVAGNFDELKAQIATFNGALIIVLGLLGIGFVIAILVQVHFGLRPLGILRQELTQIRKGEAETLTGQFPVEVKPVADELNLLIKANTEIIERARTQVGNLAHALKTPLSVLANEARLNKGNFGNKVSEQTGIMRDQVDMYLDRARRAASAQTIRSVTSVDETADALARTLMRIHMDRGLQINVFCEDENLKFRGEKQDLEEMLGNLMENASKWARSTIEVRIRETADNSKHDRCWLEISVGDDGPGLPAEIRDQALIRGRRLDESKPGTGLGLSIVTETAAMYHGVVTLDESRLGGLKAILKLPAVKK